MPPATSWQRHLASSWQRPIPLSLLLLLFGPTSPIKLVFFYDMLVLGGATFLSGALLRFAALPTWEADRARYRSRNIEHHRAIAAPLTLLGALISGLGCAHLLLPEGATTKIVMAAIFLSIVAVCGSLMIRVWRARR